MDSKYQAIELIIKSKALYRKRIDVVNLWRKKCYRKKK
jgi:hypothetical protein